MAAAFAAVPALADTPLREVNITQGSTAGWIPSEDLEAEAITAWRSYYGDIAQGDYHAAWLRLDPAMQRDLPLAEFIEQQSEYVDLHGALVERTPLKLTWTKDGPSVPEAGIYLAIDASAKFEKTQRECGYTIMFKKPGSDGFAIKRFETTAISDAAFASAVEQNSLLDAALIWNAVSRVCPNYSPPPLPAGVEDGIEFATVEEAGKVLGVRNDLKVRTENGWTIMTDETAMTVWSFAPSDSVYYPTVIKRSVRNVPGGGAQMEMAMRCEVEKAVCDALLTEMAARNGLIPVSFESVQLK